MGCWGMGITQSDEYGEVYDRFMEEYDEGKPVRDITKEILEEYLSEFEPDDGVLHDVYFALGKAEWMCGGVSDDIFRRITEIVEKEENISFYRELEATEKDLKLRKKNLEKFLSSLSVPRGKTRKRKIPAEKYIPKPPAYVPLPNVHCGDIFVCENNGGYRAFAVTADLGLAVFCYAWRKTFIQIPTIELLLEEDILPLGWFKGETFPNMEKLILVENVSLLDSIGYVLPRAINKGWKPSENALAKEENLFEEYPQDLCMPLKSVLEKIKWLKEFV